MEMMVVVAILVVLVGVAVPIYINYLENSKVTRARIDIETISNAVEAYYMKHDQYPANLEALVQPPDGSRPFLKATALRDPWGNAYIYNQAGQKNNGQKPDVSAMVPGGTREIGNWQDVRESK